MPTAVPAGVGTADHNNGLAPLGLVAFLAAAVVSLTLIRRVATR